MYEIKYGAKYEKGLDVKEIAKRFRAEVKAAQAAGELPKELKLSVKISRYSGGRSIDVKIKACPFPVMNAKRMERELANPHEYIPGVLEPIYNEPARALKAKLSDMLEAYNFDGSESQVDYFHVNFYGGVDFDWTLEKAERDALKELRAAVSVEVSA